MLVERLNSLPLLLFAALFAVSATGEEASSALWVLQGAEWSPESRLPDFSFAGYRRGEAAIPTPPVTHNVRDFGAVGDGVHNDSAAFLRAIDAVDGGVLFIPAGRYLVSEMLLIDKPGLVLRGEGARKSILYCPTPLNEIKPNWGATTGGRRTSNYAWSGGFVQIRGADKRARLADIVAGETRGASAVTVNDASPFAVGQEVELRVEDDDQDSLAQHLYSEDPRVGIDNLNSRTHASIVARITSIEGSTLFVDRPLRFDIRAEWNPAVYRFEPSVTESGLEEIGFEFPNTPYEGHFTELGYNAFAIYGVAHCWVRNIRIHNADSGGFVSGRFNTVDGVVYTSDREQDKERRSTGHHGVYHGGDDNLFTNFDFQTEFIHDLTVSHCAGNVFSEGRGIDLSLDHHCRAPYENLFTAIDAGRGTRVWRSGGGHALGAHCGARGTFWNIVAARPIAPPGKNFGPWSMNLVGVLMDAPETTSARGTWRESPDSVVVPGNLHESQRANRVREGSSK
jgi:hypothetical protein